MTTETPSITRDHLLRAIKYSPTEMQADILDDFSRAQLIAGGWRGGKSQTAAIKAFIATMEFIALYPDEAAGGRCRLTRKMTSFNGRQTPCMDSPRVMSNLRYSSISLSPLALATFAVYSLIVTLELPEYGSYTLMTVMLNRTRTLSSGFETQVMASIR